MQTFSDIIFRVLAPILFVFGIVALFTMNDSVRTSSQTVKNTYREDNFVNEEYITPPKDEKASYEELMGILASGPTVPMRISVPSQFFTAEIKIGKGVNSSVIIKYNDTTIYEGNYGISQWSTSEFPFSKIPNVAYRKVIDFDDNGLIKQITYIGEVL